MVPNTPERNNCENQVRYLRMELQIIALELEKIEDTENARKAGYAAIPPYLVSRLKRTAFQVQPEQREGKRHDRGR